MQNEVENAMSAVEQAGGGEVISAFATLPPKALLSKKAIGGILRCSIRQVDRLVVQNELPAPALRMRGRNWWTAGGIQAFIEQRIQQAAEDRARLERRPV